MKIGFIGAGKVGFSLGKLLAEKGIPLSGYMSRNRQSAQEAAVFTGSACYEEMGMLIKESDAVFLTVPDGQIAAVYAQLRRYPIENKIIGHCSGALSCADAFGGMRQTGAQGISIHPLYPVSDRYTAYKGMEDAFFCAEGDEPACGVLEALFARCGLRMRRITAKDKVRYHAACVMASNLMCALAAQSAKLLTGCGFEPEEATQALAPLMLSNVHRTAEVGPVQALTGPVERGDAQTISRHMQALEGKTLEAYRVLSELLIDTAQEKHPERAYEQLRGILAQGKGADGDEAYGIDHAGNENER